MDRLTKYLYDKLYDLMNDAFFSYANDCVSEQTRLEFIADILGEGFTSNETRIIFKLEKPVKLTQKFLEKMHDLTYEVTEEAIILDLNIDGIETNYDCVVEDATRSLFGSFLMNEVFNTKANLHSFIYTEMIEMVIEEIWDINYEDAISSSSGMAFDIIGTHAGEGKHCLQYPDTADLKKLARYIRGYVNDKRNHILGEFGENVR